MISWVNHECVREWRWRGGGVSVSDWTSEWRREMNVIMREWVSEAVCKWVQKQGRDWVNKHWREAGWREWVSKHIQPTVNIQRTSFHNVWQTQPESWRNLIIYLEVSAWPGKLQNENFGHLQAMQATEYQLYQWQTEDPAGTCAPKQPEKKGFVTSEWKSKDIGLQCWSRLHHVAIPFSDETL